MWLTRYGSQGYTGRLPIGVHKPPGLWISVSGSGARRSFSCTPLDRKRVRRGYAYVRAIPLQTPTLPAYLLPTELFRGRICHPTLCITWATSLVCRHPWLSKSQTVKRPPPSCNSTHWAPMPAFLLETRKGLLDHLVTMHAQYVMEMCRHAKHIYEQQHRGCTSVRNAPSM